MPEEKNGENYSGSFMRGESVSFREVLPYNRIPLVK